MQVRRLVRVLGVAFLVALPAAAHAAADLNFREFRLRHVCKKGANNGEVCCEATDCGDGTCVVDAIGKSSGLLTLIVDDDVGGIDGSKLAGTKVRAFTALLELKGKGKPIFAQTFQDLDDSSLAQLLDSLATGPADEFGFVAGEGLLKQFVDPTDLGTPLDIGFLIYRTLDAETLAQLRTDAGLDPGGPELFVIEPRGLKIKNWVDHFSPTTPGDDTSPDTDPFASVLRVKFKAFFVSPKAPQCP